MRHALLSFVHIERFAPKLLWCEPQGGIDPDLLQYDPEKIYATLLAAKHLSVNDLEMVWCQFQSAPDLVIVPTTRPTSDVPLHAKESYLGFGNPIRR
jgi:hypothetical protein